MSEFLQIPIPMSMFTGPELIGLGAVPDLWHPHAPALAILTFHMVTAEMDRRNYNRDNPDAIREAGYGRIRPSDWSDKDIADSLLFCWGFTEHTRDPKLGEFLDAMGNVFVEIAADRLRNSPDPRNASSFEERNSPKESTDDAPATE